jgi:DNA-binding MarR family transcriptional regulator
MLENKAFLGRQLDLLSSLIAAQSKNVFQQSGIEVPVKSCSTLFLLEEAGELSTADISRGLDTSHQLVKQKVSSLLKLDFIQTHDDKMDKRRKVFTLTNKGREQCDKLRNVLPVLSAVYEELYQEIGANLLSKCKEAVMQLEETTLLKRVEMANDQL